MEKFQFDVIIVGAGAAGLMCAQLAGSFNQKVLILDHSTNLAEKIRISGGGRCNFTNTNASPECYISENKHFIKSSLSRYTPFHFTEMLDNFNIGYHEKTLGQLFCNDKSQAIINLLDFLCNDNNVIRKMGVTVEHIEKINSGFKISTSSDNFYCEKLVIATGGLAIPQIGATGFGYKIAEQFGIEVAKTYPALVPLTLDPKDLSKFKHLSGVSFLSETSTEKILFKENSLFTHRGLSGPAILQISSYWQAGNKININLVPSIDISNVIEENRSSNKLLSNLLNQFVSSRLSDSIVKILGFDDKISQLSNTKINQISSLIHNFNVIPSGTEGYKKAEVTRGGVSTKKLNSKTMMSNQVEGLYFIGEVVDVTGWLGGYNFQWAWSSAYAAASSF